MFPQKLRGGSRVLLNTIPLEPVSIIPHIATIQLVSCPTCNAKRGQRCVVPQGYIFEGRGVRIPHIKRRELYNIITAQEGGIRI